MERVSAALQTKTAQQSAVAIGVTAAAYGAYRAARHFLPTFDMKCQQQQYKARAAYAIAKVRVRSALRRIGLGPRAVRPSDETISAAWLTKVLRKANVLADDEFVTEATMAPMSNNRGLNASMFIVEMTFNKSDVKAPATLALKMSRCDSFSVYYNNIAWRCAREAYFYRRLGPHYNFVPKAYYTYACPTTGEYVMLMENAKPQYEGVNHYFGNQVWGAEDVRNPLPQLDMLKLMFLRAADMHARYWNDESLLRQSWLKGVQWYKGSDRVAWMLGAQAAIRSWQGLRQGIEDGTTEVEWSESVIKALNECEEHSSWERLQRRLKDRSLPFTLTHGDFHASNMLYTAPPEDPRSLLMVDWSEVGLWEPTTELGQTIISDVRPEVWQGHDKELVKAYWERLVENGVDAEAYPFEVCWDHYCRGAAERWLWMLPILGGFGLPAFALQYFHDQVQAFIEEHPRSEPYYYTTVACFA